MNHQHKELAAGRWQTFSFFFQMANIGSEVLRALKWQTQNPETSRRAAERAIELLDLSIDDVRNHTRSHLFELWRLRDCVADFFFFDNEYHSTPESWHSYFNAFTFAASLERGV